MKILKAVLVLLLLLLTGLALFVWSGLYNVGADVPHTRLVYELLDTLRERSIDRHAAGIQVPPLDDPQMIAKGAEHYAAMCSDCHSAPGAEESEIRPGLYPRPPKLAELTHADPAEQFWVIKHGIKLSAMPAWGPTHDDDAIWAMVAFLQRLPGLTPQQYAQMTANAGEEHEEHEHHHGAQDKDEKDE
jgi:mono/diheme cytochrome c family protein